MPQILCILRSFKFDKIRHSFLKHYLQSSFKLTSIAKKKTYRDFHIPPASSTINTPHQGGTCVTANESVPTLCNSPNPIVCTMVSSWYGTFYQFRQVYNDISITVMTTQDIFIALQILCASSIHPSPNSHSNPRKQFFYCLHSFAFSRMSCNWKNRVYRLCILVTFTW